MRILKTNKLVSHPSYGRILIEYNEWLKKDGKVNKKKFYEQVVLREIPGYDMNSWYYHINKFDNAPIPSPLPASPPPPTMEELKTGLQEITQQNIVSNKEATASAITKALNIGNNRLSELLENPQLMSMKDAIDLIFKAMKAQDSRIHAIGKVKEDNREEQKMERAFANQVYDQ